ncbi:MAG: ArsR family transcriptional regulator, partial [Phreatobacter sp.]|nr:ArsR family transcriptional regulator [Phreatobacter sp.]
FAMSLPAVSKHLKVLEQAGLISRSREAQWRPCKLEAAPMREASEWLERYRVMWEAKLDRLADYLERTAADETASLTSPPDEGQAS